MFNRWAAAGARVGALGALGALLLAMTVQKIWGADFWWQLAAGRWIVERGWVPAVDHFSYTVAGAEWIELRWVFCVAIYLGWQVGGAGLLIQGQVAVLAATWAAVVWPSRRALLTVSGTGLVALGLTAGLGRWVLRPELVTFLMMAVFLAGLDAVARGVRASGDSRLPPVGDSPAVRGRGRGPGVWLWLLPLLQVVWVNAHTLFVMGPVLCWIFALADGAQRLWRRIAGDVLVALVNWRLVLVAALVSVACLANPYLVRGAIFPLLLWREIQGGHVVAENIGEMFSPLAIPLSRWTPDLWAAAALALVGALTFVRRWRRVNLARLAVFAAGAYLASKAHRNAALFAVMGTWAALRNVSETAAETEGETRGAWAGPARIGGHVGVAMGCLGMVWWIATDRLWEAIGAPRESGIGVVEWNTPEAAVRFVRESGARGPVFNAIRDGGYLAWAAPGVPVFVDGRMEVYREAFLAHFFSINGANWEQVAERWGFRTAIVPTNGFDDVARRLAALPGWRLVFLDPRAYIFVRDVPQHAALISRHAIDPTAPVQVGGGAVPMEAWKRAIGGIARVRATAALADAYLLLGSMDNAARLLDAALERSPGNEGTIARLAAIERFRGSPRGLDLARRLAPESEWAVWSNHSLAGMLDAAGRKAEAASAMERVVLARPGERASRIGLADMYFQLQQFDRARDHYLIALEGTTGPAAEWLKLGYACEQTGELIGAIDAYRVSLAADPNQPAVFVQLGKLLERTGNKAGAAWAFEAALRLNPESKSAREGLERVRGR